MFNNIYNSVAIAEEDTSLDTRKTDSSLTNGRDSA